jgi:starch synthase
MPSLRILMVTAEFAPAAKAGGLADMVAGLSRALTARGHDVRVLMPRYALPGMPADVLAAGSFLSPVRVGGGHPEVQIQAARLGPVPAWLIAAPGLAAPGVIYGDGVRELQRFALLAHAILPVLRATGFVPDIVHCHDWHTALGPLLLRATDAGPRSVLTLHNIGYQGWFDPGLVADLGLAACREQLHAAPAAPGSPSFLATGIAHADVLTTVSPTHARELLTPEFGHGLDAALRARSGVLHGILNGVDYGEWDPARDPHLPARYSAADRSGKRVCRDALAATCGLAADPTPLLGCVSRLATQKGLDLLAAALPELLAAGRLRAVVLGSGDQALARAFTALAARFPGRCAFLDRHDETLARRVYAAADLFAVPSRYEPCGLTQMYALRYGAVHVVRATGGLADTVTHFDPATGRGTGSVFRDADPGGVRWAIEQALTWHADPATWARVVGNGMAADFSWDRQVQAYVDVYAGAGAPGAPG